MENFNRKVHMIGRLTVIICIAAFVSAALILAQIYDSSIDFQVVIKNATPIVVMFTIAGISENLSYTPIIGPGALYISCITGNLSNIKVPAAINGQALLEVEPGSEKADVISIIVVSVCTMVTTALMFLGMLFLAPLIAPIYNNPAIKPAFDNVLPALFGALMIPQLVANPKVNLPIFLIPAIIYLIVGQAFFSANQSYILILCALFAIGYSYMMSKKEIKKDLEQA